MKRAKTHEEIKPLIELCKVGKLFDVQAWIAAGKPVNPPPPPEKGARKRSPLQYAIDTGFHSLVQVLLDGEAEIEHSWRYSSLRHALESRHFEVAKLLVEYGADVKSIDMVTVFDTWQPEIMEYFIERGANVETGNPLATAFCWRIRTALKIFKQYKDRFPSFQEQANIALRHHCKEGNLKWVALMLWAGADPYSKGLDSPEADPDPDYDKNALELAAFYEHFEVFKFKKIRLDAKHEHAHGLVRMACYNETAELLNHLLELGYPVNDQKNGGSSYIELLLNYMAWDSTRERRHLDTEKAREKMKMLHLLVRHGAKWIPEDMASLNRTRRNLLCLIPDYTVELIWIIAKYGACDQSVIESLLKTPAIRAHVTLHSDRISQLVEKLAENEAKRRDSCG
ncbi:MAG: ankyrin repeat domain-containing protein [Verrucomicrobia bacterium]|nr:ankyrin repeat domain-containing protein [Verrucomicrobiota bacterium]MBU1734013.1 ankyrin repeat domain-containing protein [Verrucomicrobiota bacterium]MBU1857109.1 ankyrin repeat domain-containing protein [Verrucomicrobiota bacterium]